MAWLGHRRNDDLFEIHPHFARWALATGVVVGFNSLIYNFGKDDGRRAPVPPPTTDEVPTTQTSLAEIPVNPNLPPIGIGNALTCLSQLALKEAAEAGRPIEVPVDAERHFDGQGNIVEICWVS